MTCVALKRLCLSTLCLVTPFLKRYEFYREISALCTFFSLMQGIVDIQFINLSDYVRLEEGDVFQMVESTVYFEAYRHILEGLKEVDPRRLPLQV